MVPMRPETTSPYASPRSRRLRLVALAACLLALGCSAQAPGTAPTTPVTSAAIVPTGELDGRVMLPEEAVGPSHVIPTGIGRVIPTGQGRYRVAAVEDELPVTGADVAVFDPTTHQPLGTTRTDAEGRFKLAGLATGRNVLVQVTAMVGDTTFHLLALARPATAEAVPSVAVSWRSTAVVETLLKTPNTDLATYSPTAEAEAEAALAQQVAAETPAERTAAIVGAITQAATSVLLPTPAPSASVSGATGLLSSPLPSTGLTPVDSTVASTVPAVTGTLASTAPAVTTTVASTVPAVTQTVGSTVQSTAPQLQNVVSDTTSTATNTTTTTTTTQTVTQTTTGTLGAVTTSLSSTPAPTPTATPTPAPTPTPLLGGVIGL